MIYVSECDTYAQCAARWIVLEHVLRQIRLHVTLQDFQTSYWYVYLSGNFVPCISSAFHAICTTTTCYFRICNLVLLVRVFCTYVNYQIMSNSLESLCFVYLFINLCSMYLSNNILLVHVALQESIGT